MKVDLREMSLFVYGLILSALIGSISFIFIKIEAKGAQLLWSLIAPDNHFRLLYILGITVTGGVLLGFSRKKWGNLPVIAHDALSELKSRGTVNYRQVFRSLGVALIVLIFGAGVGPEAGLLGAVVLLSVWQADKLRYYYFNYGELKTLSLGARLKRLAHPVEYVSAYEAERSQKENKQAKKKIFNILFVFNGLLTFTFLMKLVDTPSFITKMGASNWRWQELWLAVPLIIFGLLYGFGFNLIKKIITKYFTLWADFPIRRALLGSLFIFLIGIFLPNLLFSGQLSLAIVPILATKTSFLLLTFIAFIKLLFLEMCLRTGWVGGDIFPVAFAAIIQGFALAQLLPQYDSLFVVAVVSTSMAISILQQPMLVGIFLMLFFPLNLTPLILVIALACHFGKAFVSKSQVKS